MKQIAFFIALLTLALADKPDPIYKSPVQQAKTARTDVLTEKSDNLSQYGSPAAPAQDTYGSPQSPAQDSYGSPQAPPQQDTYGSPQAAPVGGDSYGSPQADPVAPPAQGNVGTQGYYYYYYPVASSPQTSGSSYPGHKAGSSSGSNGGLLGGGGGLLIPLVLGLGLLLLLAVGAAAVFNNGRSFYDGSSIIAALSPYTEELAVTVYDALKVYANLNDVTEER